MSENHQYSRGDSRKQTKVTQDPEESDVIETEALDSFIEDVWMSNVPEKELEPYGK